MNETNKSELWDRCLLFIKDNVNENIYNTWFKPTKFCSYENQTLTIGIPSQFFYEVLEEKFLGVIQGAIFKEIGEKTTLRYKVMVDQTNNHMVEVESTPRANIPQQQVQTKQIPGPFTHDLDPHLNPEYNFENFIEGVSNKLSRSVAASVAENPGKTTFNPLFIYGASGVGKTHLANAIGAKIKELYPPKRVLYISANMFRMQYSDAVLKNKSNDFLYFYQSIDVLIVDDIQELIGAEKTQNNFFHVFNHLRDNGKQIIMTSDRSPSDLQGMTERLITRFKWGMVAELEKPNKDLRKSILRNKIEKDGLDFPEDVIDFIAENVGDSIRDLEGTIVSIMAHSTVFNKDINLELAQVVLKKVSGNKNREITIDVIMDTVAEHFGQTKEDLLAKTRRKDVVLPRQIAMYLASEYTSMSEKKIGIMLGGKNHSTVHHACKTIRQQLEVDKELQAEVGSIRGKL